MPGPSKLTYESSHGAWRKITPAAKIAEMVCERIAAHEGASLPARFWVTPRWKGTWGNQLAGAHALLKIYDFESVLRALAAKPRVRSLWAAFFQDDVQEQQLLLEAEHARAVAAPPVEVASTMEGPRTGVRRRNSPRSRMMQRSKSGEGEGGVAESGT